jgi:hypothetical protein
MAVPEAKVAAQPEGSAVAIQDGNVAKVNIPNTDTWSRFFSRCLAKRIKKDQFEELHLELCSRAPYTGRRIVDGLFGHYQQPTLFIDPLVMPYLETLLDNHSVSCADVLSSLFDRSRYCPLSSNDADKDGKPKAIGCLTTMEHLLVDLVAREIYSNRRPRTSEEAKAILRVTTKWLNALSNAANLVLLGMDAHFGLICDSVGLLTIACFENLKMIHFIDVGLPKRKSAHRANITTYAHLLPADCKSLAHAVEAFIATWTHSTSSQQTQNANRLINAIKLRAVLQSKVSEKDRQAAMENQSQMELQATPDVPLINSRQAMFIFLSSMVSL